MYISNVYIKLYIYIYIYNESSSGRTRVLRETVLNFSTLHSSPILPDNPALSLRRPK